MARLRRPKPIDARPATAEAEPVPAARSGPGPRKPVHAKPAPARTAEPSPSTSAQSDSAARQKLEAEAMRQAECAAMLVAVTRMLLDLRGRDFAKWLRSIADDFEASDLETETPEDLARDLIRLSRDGGSATPDKPEGHSGEGSATPETDPRPAPHGRLRPH